MEICLHISIHIQTHLCEYGVIIWSVPIVYIVVIKLFNTFDTFNNHNFKPQ